MRIERLPGAPETPIAALRAKLARDLPRPRNNTADPARQAERDAQGRFAAAEDDAPAVPVVEAVANAATAQPQRMAPNPAQGSSGIGAMPTPEPTSPLERIRREAERHNNHPIPKGYTP